ncbi:hypothetical protein [Streptomyces griseoviridis]|uniref:hypothetical protein n=1 Tax=Streptomyces griseoviridis TaxID=45398 RepID=UPI00345456DD
MQPFIDLTLDILDRHPAPGTLDALPGPRNGGAAPARGAAPPPGTCPSRRCGGRFLLRHGEGGATVCVACSDLADEHHRGAHDQASHEYCPACSP